MKFLIRTKPSRVRVPMSQAGISLIELMVGLAAGLVLIAGASQVYLANKQTYRLQDAQSRLQEDGRFVAEFLAKTIRPAGFKTYSWTAATAGYPIVAGTGTNPAFAARGQVISAVYGSGSVADLRKLSVRYQGAADGSLQDCLGGALAANTTAISTFSVDTKGDTIASNDELQCTATNGGTTTTQPFVNGFGITHILFGVDTDSPMDRAANRYLSAANVGANWANVVSVRVSYQLVSSENNLLAAPESYTLNGVNYTDRRLRRNFSTTIALRNGVP
ncbi:MAG: PilW family protein [Methylotetracoccus sp.]